MHLLVLVSSIRIWISFILDNVTHRYPHFCKKAWKIKFKKYHTIFDYDHTSQSTIKNVRNLRGKQLLGQIFGNTFFYKPKLILFHCFGLRRFVWNIINQVPKKKKKKRERKKKFPLKAWTFKNVGFFFLFLG